MIDFNQLGQSETPSDSELGVKVIGVGGAGAGDGDAAAHTVDTHDCSIDPRDSRGRSSAVA